MKFKQLTPDDLIKELALDRFVSKSVRSDMTDKCKKVFVAQIKNTFDRAEQTDTTLAFIKTLWRKYDCERIADIYGEFVKMEEALFGLEREEEKGKRYRDHFVHMFNCFVFGLRIISSLLAQCDPETAKKLFKIEDERLKGVGLPFGKDYGYKERLFYLWTLISTFHDIAIPFEHMERLGEGITRFISKFRWVFTNPRVSMHEFDSSQLHYYFNLIGSVYGGRLTLTDRKRKYKRPKETQHYLTKLLGRHFDENNHGVLSGFFMWKTIEEVFLVGHSLKYDLTIDQFNKYTEYVLEQDIARAALAISLHAIKKDERSEKPPKVFPLDFGSFPLSFLLVLSDELQEYLRWEGASIGKELRFTDHPVLDARLRKKKGIISLSVSFSLDSKNQDAIIAQARQMAVAEKSESSITDFNSAVDLIGDSTKKTLERKLKLGENFKLNLSIYQDWDSNKRKYTENLCSSK